MTHAESFPSNVSREKGQAKDISPCLHTCLAFHLAALIRGRGTAPVAEKGNMPAGRPAVWDIHDSQAFWCCLPLVCLPGHELARTAPPSVVGFWAAGSPSLHAPPRAHDDTGWTATSAPPCSRAVHLLAVGRKDVQRAGLSILPRLLRRPKCR